MAPCLYYFVLIFSATATLASGTEQATILGLDTGELLRCKFDNSSDCTTISQQDCGINTFAVVGEFIYLGHQYGELRRCRLDKSENCTRFHQVETEISALAVAGKFIYAASTDGITRCGLRKSEDCSKFYASERSIYSLAISGKYIFAGTDEAVIFCQLDSPTNCSIAFNTSSAANALSVYAKHMYVGLNEGSVLQCELNNLTECAKLFETQFAVKALDVFDEQIQASLESGDLIRYNPEFNDTEITATRENGLVMAMSTIYATTGIFRHYNGESIGCTWQFFSCPPYVIYYDVESRAALELHVKNGKLYNTMGELFDTSESHWGHSGNGAIFVMDPAGRIFASTQHPILLLHHSSLMAGQPVAAAGEIEVDEGVIKVITSCSGHYRPRFTLTKQIKSSLRRKGYTENITFRNCFGMELLIDLDYRKTDLYYKKKYEEYARKVKNMKV